MVTISLTDFIEFSSKAGMPRITQVRRIMDREMYDPRMDYWKALRDEIIRFHQTPGRDKKELDRVLTRIHYSKRANYTLNLRGYRRFLGRKETVWIRPVRGFWKHAHLRVTVNPELALEINGTPHVLKLVFKLEGIPSNRRHSMIELMHQTLASQYPEGTVFGILDVARGKLIKRPPPSPRLRWLLTSDADAFLSAWKSLSGGKAS